jgi:hypothetical protein
MGDPGPRAGSRAQLIGPSHQRAGVAGQRADVPASPRSGRYIRCAGRELALLPAPDLRRPGLARKAPHAGPGRS